MILRLLIQAYAFISRLLLNNNLKILEKDAFFGLNTVVNIYLESNYLEYLNLHSWRHMAGLTWL